MTSDSSWKEWVPLPYGLDDVLKVQTIMYKWKSQAEMSDDDPAKQYQYFGVCADQLNALFPELIYNEQKPFQINYAELIPLCVNAIRDLDAKNAALQLQIDALVAKIV